ncbi:Predicted kinase, aminoglycoside phosphotransferase (APT) family [Amphibacillus marinus]|uniref:Predicted kinase, aminoglycoside phosphotransferase (APT) family n=1 Tax=Amphibacillus marinus TaxID=872970 RepID=A0A1H8LNL8_9BACI|nr:phosphotransferase [Amphibacillus marinus]SEO06741.1 Predicted kinase, aminoglycoside phosphotransferase (APT) family [Amphibacillus marinus]
MGGVLQNPSYRTVKQIKKGWSSDQKYFVRTIDDKALLIRQTELSAYDQKVSEFNMLKTLTSMGFHTNQPIELIPCKEEETLYMIMSWCHGQDAEIILPTLTNEQHYQLGIKAGQMLRTIHDVNVPAKHQDWQAFYLKKTEYKIKKYLRCDESFDGDTLIINYLQQHQELLNDRPQCFHHGDYHLGNMILTENNDLAIIDFNRHDVGDPWEEFNRLSFSAKISPAFATGQIDGYFAGTPPKLFFQTLAFYFCSNIIGSLPWAIPYGTQEVAFMKRQAADFLQWFEAGTLPDWYLSKS